MYLSFFLFSIIIVLTIDVYYYTAVKRVFEKLPQTRINWIKSIYWCYTVLSITFLVYAALTFYLGITPPKFARIYLFGVVFIVLISKIIGSLFILIDDLKNITLRFWRLIKYTNKNVTPNPNRRVFLKKTALTVSALPFGTLMYGVMKTAFDFRVRKQKLRIANLPVSFKGLKIVQISDVHIGSFLSDKPIIKAAQIIKDLNPDLVFFTGDLVNDIAEEALPFIEALKEISAPLGVYSVLGNHDYGDYYYQKDDLDGKKHNYNLMKTIHRKLGWQLLLNEHRIIKKGTDRLAILGVENWGDQSRFQKYGDIDKAKKECLDNDVKLLLSHDPSHWDAQVVPNHKDIACTFSGHTHGMQFGIEVPGIKWSPSKYIYEQWAGNYQKDEQQIYVNRGLGFIGYPGRVGILPEITFFELT